ncbi:MAG: hypothetical protein QM537_02255 [Candidatus Symbiobacter sp.]|nr:hypothetical protein [Candidatus Symbiobacter sp.]
MIESMIFFQGARQSSIGGIAQTGCKPTPLFAYGGGIKQFLLRRQKFWWQIAATTNAEFYSDRLVYV